MSCVIAHNKTWNTLEYMTEIRGEKNTRSEQVKKLLSQS